METKAESLDSVWDSPKVSHLVIAGLLHKEKGLESLSRLQPRQAFHRWLTGRKSAVLRESGYERSFRPRLVPGVIIKPMSPDRRDLLQYFPTSGRFNLIGAPSEEQAKDFLADVCKACSNYSGVRLVVTDIQVTRTVLTVQPRQLIHVDLWALAKFGQSEWAINLYRLVGEDEDESETGELQPGDSATPAFAVVTMDTGFRMSVQPKGHIRIVADKQGHEMTLQTWERVASVLLKYTVVQV